MVALGLDALSLEEQVSVLKAKVSELAPDEPKVKGKGKGGRYIPKTPLGMRDYGPEEMAVRERVFDVIKRVFKRHGAQTIETPVAELKETLTGKYGEDSKLIYDLANQGGEILALRYDLTVPFARYCAEHGVETLKRYHIARVYRRDQPAMTQGRYREFYQTDLDIAGDFEPMVPDAECIKIATDVLGELDVGDFVVKVNHRCLLDGIFEVCGVPLELFRPICSAVDKLDKLAWPEVRKEMEEKGISGEVAEKIWVYAQRSGGAELVEALLQDAELCANESAKAALDDMRLLFDFCACLGVPAERVSFDLSLARGLDYYTGVIFEAVLVGQKVGSVAGGGRYDNLVGMFLEAKAGKKKKKGKAGKKIPCVGISLGIERLFTVVAERQRLAASPVSCTPTRVLVAGIARAPEKQEVLRERLRLCETLWAAGINAETSYKTNAKLLTQYQLCEKSAIPVCVYFGMTELAEGVVTVRTVASREEIKVPRADLVQAIQKVLAAVDAPGAAAPTAAPAAAAETGQDEAAEGAEQPTPAAADAQ